MRAWLLVCAALALAPCRATAARPHPDPARLERIKSQILAKLGLTTRPTPLGAPPRDVVRQILARAADPHPKPTHIEDNEQAIREVIAIAHRGCEGNLNFHPTWSLKELIFRLKTWTNCGRRSIMKSYQPLAVIGERRILFSNE